LGGSTTECYYLSDGKTWPDRLGAELKTWFPRAWVNNAGMDGQSTFGHIKLFEQHIADLHPKVVLIMAGVNDQAKSREGLYDGNVRPAGPPPANLSGRVTHWLSRHSETYALGFVIVRSLAAQKTGVGHGNLNFAAMGEVTVPGDVAEKVLSAHRPYIPAYGERLVRLAEMIRAHGALPVFVTQAAMWGEGTDPTTGRSIGLWGSAVEPLPDGKTATINAATSWHILELYNEETRQIGARFGVPVVDLGREMAKDSKFFYDWYHMANEGAAEAGRLIARDLCPILKSAFPGQANSSACPG
jgi:lysophospholipase L1-like esterase